MSVNVVYATDTGHVLGALALTGPAGDTPAVADLVGDALPLPVTLGDRTAVALPVPASHLAATAVEDTPGVLAWPLRYGVERAASNAPPEARAASNAPPEARAASSLLRLAFWPADAAPVTVTPDGVTVTLPERASAPTPVLVLLRGSGGTPVILPKTIESGETTVTLRVPLASGEYGVLTLVAGWEGRLDAVSLP